MKTQSGKMKAVQIRAYGGNEVVEISPNALRPSTSEGSVLVEVHAAGVNPVDWKIRQGYLAERLHLEFPSVLGGDFSGVIVEVGKGVSHLRKGDEVYGQAGAMRGGSGSFAEYVLASTKYLSKKPKNLSHVEAAALPLVGVSALQALVEHIGLKKNQRILIHGAAGGIGTMAVQIARHIGAFVYATALGKDADYVRDLGADMVIDYSAQRFEDVARDLDAVFDTVGGETYARSFATLKRGGVIVSMLEKAGEELMNQYGVKAIAQFTQITAERLKKLTELVEQGFVKVHVDKTFPLNEAPQAMQYLQAGHTKGKVVLRIR